MKATLDAPKATVSNGVPGLKILDAMLSSGRNGSSSSLLLQTAGRVY
jgi:hypothetical protein